MTSYRLLKIWEDVDPILLEPVYDGWESCLAGAQKLYREDEDFPESGLFYISYENNNLKTLSVGSFTDLELEEDEEND